MSHFHAVVWIDHSEAHVIHFSPDDVEQFVVRPNHPHHKVHSTAGTLGDGITARSTPTVTGTDASLASKTITLYNGSDVLGTGVADDKSIYPYVPEMVQFYLGEEPLLKNVQTWQCRKPAELSYVLANLGELVVKEVHGAGGYGMLVGPASTKAEIAEFAQRVRARPDNYIAQPTLSLSACPTFVEQGLAPRHIDLRPFVLSGKTTTIVPGGLTRVALREGSLVVNSSQGGGTKDTWVLEAPEAT